MKVGLAQLTSSDDPEANLPATRAAIAEAAGQGAELVLTPEVTNCVSASRTHQRAVLRAEPEDATLAALRSDAAALKTWVLIGSLALKSETDDRFVNRSFLINPQGEIAARYDKIHMFDVAISAEETYRESDGYRPGGRAVLAATDQAKIGMTICYDLRFPHLFRRLAIAGAQVLTVPAAFSTVSGAAHWHTLLKARAIETGSWVLAPAQTGIHPASKGKVRETYGHSLAVSPWGEVVCDMGQGPATAVIEMDLAEVGEARRRIPSLLHDRAIRGPE